MMLLTSDFGRPLGIMPNTLVVGPSLETAARNLLVADKLASGASNPWVGTASLIITPHLG